MTGAHPQSPTLALCAGESDAAIRLVCIPHAGAGASAFASWRESLPPDVHLCVVRLPGRESRLTTSLLPDVGTMAYEIADAIAPGGGHIVLFGHCSGAVLAFETALEVAKRGWRPLRTIFVCAQEAPHKEAYFEGGSLHDLASGDLQAALLRIGGLSQIVADDPELWSLLEPVIRADLKAFDNHRIKPGALLREPIVALFPSSDSSCSLEGMRDWLELTTGSFRLVEFSGGHFPLVESRSELLEAITESLR